MFYFYIFFLPQGMAGEQHVRNLAGDPRDSVCLLEVASTMARWLLGSDDLTGCEGSSRGRLTSA
jgi:hypothetical protein